MILLSIRSVKCVTILSFICLFFSNACTQEESKELEKLIPTHVQLQRVPSFICDFYLENGFFPSGRNQFDSYLKTRADTELFRLFLDSIDYQIREDKEGTQTLFLLNNAQELSKLKDIEYEWFGTEKETNDGIPLLVISHRKCDSFIKKNLEPLLFTKDSLLFENESIIDQIRALNLDAINSLSQDKGSIYVPKSKSIEKRLSLVIFSRPDVEEWRFSIIEKEHDNLTDLKAICSKVNSSLATMSIPKEVRYIKIPMRYYEEDQLIKLE